MSQFQIAFREMLVQENLCKLADAMRRKLKRELGRDASLEVLVQPVWREARCSVQLRVSAKGGAQSVSAESRHANPVIALRKAFEQAHGSLFCRHGEEEPERPRAAPLLLLFRPGNHGSARPGHCARSLATACSAVGHARR
jgi:hypothetical protein